VRAERKYIEFHTTEPNSIGRFNVDMKIPSTAKLAGTAVNVLYSSDKLNPTTGEDEGWIDYIHDHKGGVRVFRTDAHYSGPTRRVPNWIASQTELTWLGYCLGFSYRDEDGYLVKADATEPLPELYTTPNGRALLVIQGKRRVVAIIWGGKLGVERRGIVG
jgi:hypothetical protein